MLLSGWSMAQDSARVGMYITSIYDLDLAGQSFTTDFWLWYNYRDTSISFLESIELFNSKEHEFTLGSVEEVEGWQWAATKCKAVVKKEWDIRNFPFDRQRLDIVIEDSELDIEEMIFIADDANTKLDSSIHLDGWAIDSVSINAGSHVYETTYGDPSISGTSTYPNVVTSVFITREGGGLFVKMFTGVYVAFLIAMLVFFIDPCEVDPRFGLSVGGLFAAVGNKYIVDSILPETTTFTMVDKIHDLTFAFLFLSIIISVVSLTLWKGGKEDASRRLDRTAFAILMGLYIAFNLVIVLSAF